MIFKPISTNYCQFQLNEYCRDSKHYLMELKNWKSTQPINLTSTLFINTADVKSLYPSVNRDLIPIALKHALKTKFSFKLEAQQIFVQLTMTCLNNVILQYLDKFYVQKNGIVTGNNHSVSIVNICMHYILLPLAKVLNKTVVFKRYIDDIIWLSYNYSTTTKIKKLHQAQFSNFNLQLVFNSIKTGNMDNELEFLDVLHVTTLNAKGGFITKNFIKSTAKDRYFLNGASHHPTSVYKSIVFGEAVRLRRLNERKSDYLKSLVNIKDKCFRSNFNQKMTENMLKIAKYWEDRFEPKHKKNRIVWATQFTKLLQLSNQEKKLKLKAAIVYKNPTTLATKLTNYKKLSQILPNTDNRSSYPCANKCALCGNIKNYKNIVKTVDSIISHSNSQKFNLKQHFTCKNYGIYVAECKFCKMQYVGQTKINFLPME